MNSYDMTGARRLRLVAALGGALALAGCDIFFGTSPDEYLSRGVAYYQEGDLASAAIEFRNVLQENPEHARARYYLGVTQLQAGDIDRARRDLERAAELGHPEEEVALPLARARAALGEHEQVLDAQPVAGMGQTERAQWHYLRGHAALLTDDLGRAEEEFRQALAADPGSADARYGQVLLAQEQGDTGLMRTWVQRTLDVDEEYAEAWRSRAMIALQDGRRSDAEAALDRAIANDNFPRAGDILRRGLLRLQRGDLQGAQADAQTLRQRGGDAPWGPYLQGLVDLREDNRSSAQSSMEEAISRTDAFAAPRLFLAAIHGEQGRYDQAEYQLDRYEASAQSDSVSRLLRVALESEKGNNDRARELLDQYLRMNPGDQRALAMRNFLDGEGGADDGSFVRTAFSGLQASGGEGAAVAGDDDPVEAQGESAPGEAYEAITEAINDRNYGAALEQVNGLLEDYPNDVELYNLKGGVHIALGELREAVESFRNVLQRDAGNVSAVRNLGQLFQRGGREDVALALYRQAHENNPDSLELALSLARAEAQQGNEARVETLVNDAIDNHPDAPEPRLLKARHALFTGDPETALVTLEPLRAVESDNAGYMRLLGEALLANNKPEDAAGVLARAAELDTRNQEISILRSRALVEAERYDEAAGVLRNLIDQSPEAVQPRILLVRLLGATGDHEGAEAAYQDLLARAGREAPVLIEGGRAALRAGDAGEAIKRFQRAQEEEPGDVVVRELVQAYLSVGDPEAALVILENWVAQRGLEQVASATLHQLAQLRQQVGEGDPMAPYERLLQRNPDDVVALNNLAWELRNQDPGRALTLAQRAVERAPESRDVAHTLAMTEAASGQVSDAITRLQEILGDPGDEAYGMQMDLAELYLQQGRHDDARPLLRQLAERDDFEERGRAAALLRELE